MAFLYEKIDALREYGSSAVLPSYIPENLNPNFELRPYQKQAFENFITHFESSNRPKPTQVLFHMATGSGKTLIMAGLMLYNIFRPTPAAGSDYYLVGNFDFAGDKRNIGTSVTGQLQYILQNPFTYALLLLKSMVQLLGTYLSGGADFFQYGYLGTGSTIFTWIVIVLGLWLALWSAKGVKRWKMPAVSIVLTLIMLLGTSAIVWSSMYVSYTTVGANEIRGVQLSLIHI